MGRASNRKWANRRARYAKTRSLSVRSHLRKLFGRCARFHR